MGHFSADQAIQSLNTTIKAVVRELYAAIERKDLLRLGELAVADVFVLGAAADAVSIDRAQFVMDLRNQFERAKDAELRVQSSEIQVGLSDSGRSAWFFDQLVIDIVGDQGIPHSIPIRLTGLLVRDHDWQLSAAYWSIPLSSNEYQFSLLQDGKIQPGAALENQIAPAAQPLAQSLIEVMAHPHTMPELYSTREDAFTIGSTVDEVFLGAEGKNWIQQIALLPLKFAVRGGIHSAVSADGCTAWMATHIDLSGGLTVQYRFFYVWLLEQDQWKIVISHDAVSIDPSNPGFDAP
jgi:ketosteroid isomerase-like protein